MASKAIWNCLFAYLFLNLNVAIKFMYLMLDFKLKEKNQFIKL